MVYAASRTQKPFFHGNNKRTGKIGPPQLPLTLIKIKDSGSALGFITKDARGYKYLIKFDDSNYPNLETTVNYVVNRIFWAFGYNVPEDYVVYFKESDLVSAANSEITQDEIDLTLWAAVPGDDGTFRATASLFIQGNILGAISQKGTRSGDLNDRVNHENLRVLRALYVFSALTDHSDIRSDNTLDAYVGDEGKGHTLHYLLDFGEAFGVHGLTNKRAWDGFEHFFSWRDTAINIVKLGLDVKPWEKLDGKLEDPRIVYESVTFEPTKWKETYQFLPLHKSLPDDNYWACKIISALTKEHLQALLDASKHPDKDYTHHVVETLMLRKEKILNHFLYEVSPLESSGIKNNTLKIEDRGRKILGKYSDTSYEVQFFNRKNKKIAADQFFSNQPVEFDIPLSEDMLSEAQGYLRVDIRVIKEGKKIDRAAEFHIRASENTTPKLVGVVH